MPAPSPQPPASSLRVVAAVIEEHGRFLVTRRLAGSHLAGYWEFPGGKCRDGESRTAGLEREIREELDVGAIVGDEILTTMYRYPEKTVQLTFFRAVLTSAPRSALGQEVRWVPRAELATLEFPPADRELLGLLSG